MGYPVQKKHVQKNVCEGASAHSVSYGARCQMTSFKCQVSSVKCQVSSVSSVLDDRCYGARCQASVRGKSHVKCVYFRYPLG